MICFAWIRLILKVYMTLPFLGQFPDVGGSTPKSSVITSRTEGVFNYISLRSTLQKLFKLFKIFRCILDT